MTHAVMEAHATITRSTGDVTHTNVYVHQGTQEENVKHVPFSYLIFGQLLDNI